MRKPAILITSLGIASMLATFAFFFFRSEPTNLLPSAFKTITNFAPKPKPKPFTFLFLGCDIAGFNGNTDSIMLIHVQPDNGRIAVMSIPRDTRVKIPGHGYQKLNAANSIGGPGLTTKLVEEITGAKVDFYALVDYKGFKDVIDALGGVYIDVERNMYYVDPYQNLRINLKKGYQHLNGEQAMQYVRFRSDALGDISRVQRQQKFFRALLEQVSKPEAYANLPKLVPGAIRTVRTNMPMNTALMLLNEEYRTTKWQVVSTTAPGWFFDVDGISYWAINPDRVKTAWADLQKGIEHPLFDEKLQAQLPVTKVRSDNSRDETNPSSEAQIVQEQVSGSVYGKVYLARPGEEPAKSKQETSPQTEKGAQQQPAAETNNGTKEQEQQRMPDWLGPASPAPAAPQAPEASQ